MARLLALVLGLMAISLVPFAIWGEGLEAALAPGAAAEWMRGFGSWAWAAGLALIASDILLPVPATAVMAALGIVYGPWIGGMLAGLGSFLAGMAGYGICRALGPEVARRLAGAEGLAQAETLFARWGGWLVAASRWLPVLPETVAFLAGLARMPAARFALALACGAAAVDGLDEAAEAPAPTAAPMTDSDRVDAAKALALEARYDAALALLRAADDSKNLRILNYTGYVLRKSGRPEEALAYYRRALELDPGYIDARSYLGQALLDMGDAAGAEEQLMEIRRRGARDSYAYVALKQAIRAKSGY